MSEPTFTNRKFSEISERFSAALQWLAEKGLNINPSRLGLYRKSLDRLVGAFAAGSQTEIGQNAPEYLAALFEIEELVDIHMGLGAMPSPALDERLAVLVGGPSNYPEESKQSSAHPRNVSFELTTAARFAVVGLTPDFSTDADVKLKFEDTTFLIECKRPQNESKIHSNVKYGLKQLSKRYALESDPERCRGLVGISATKIVNPSFGFLKVDSLGSLRSVLQRQANDFILKWEHKWRNPDDPRSIGIIMELRCVAAITEKAVWTTVCSEHVISCPDNSSARDSELLQHLAERLTK